MKIHSNPNQLRAALITAATKDIRYYLQTVCIEASEKYTRVISTDGHRASIQGQKFDNEIESEIQFLVPNSIVKMINAKDNFLEFSSENQINWTMQTNSVNVNFESAEGKFPDWRRIVPKNDHGDMGKIGQFNPEYIFDFVKAGKILGQKGNVFVHHCGENATKVTIGCSDYLGIVMPIRADAIYFPSLDYMLLA